MTTNATTAIRRSPVAPRGPHPRSTLVIPRGPRPALRFAFAVWSALAVLFAMPAARAAVTAEGAPNIMVRPFDGPKAKALNERVVKVLEEQGADLVPAGFEGPTAMETDADFASVAARLNIQAFIQGTATNDNTGWTLKLNVRQGSNGTVVGSGEFKASWFPGLLTKIDEDLINTLEKALAGAQVPAGIEDEPEAAPPPPEPEKPRPKPLELDAGAGFLFRSYTAQNPVNLPGVIQTRDQSGGMANLKVGAAFYPLALFTKDFLANIGVAGHFEHSLGGKTQAGTDPNTGVQSGDLDTSLSAYDIGLRVRLPVSQHELGFSAAYGNQQFDIDDGATDPDPVAGEPTQLVPDVDYKFIRLGADFTYALRSYFFKGDVGLRVINSAGDEAGQIQADTWFPNSDVGGMDVALTAGYNVSDRFTITLGMDFRNYYYSMNSRFEDFGLGAPPGTVPPEPPAPGTVPRNPVAGGANDMYFSGMLAARYSMR